VIDQLYRQHFGALEEATYIDTQENSGKVSAKLLLDKLFSLLTGTSLEAQGELQHKRGETKERKISETSEDRAFRLLEEIFEKGPKLNPQQVIDGKITRGIYTFSFPARISYQKIQTQGKESLIEVSHKSDRFNLAGLTSGDNWLSASILNNLIWQSVKRKETGITVSGVLSIVGVDNSKNKTEVIVQFLLISEAGNSD
jgi:hypothetical protein